MQRRASLAQENTRSLVASGIHIGASGIHIGETFR